MQAEKRGGRHSCLPPGRESERGGSSRALDGDLFGLGRARLGQPQLQHTIAATGLRLLGLRTRRQGECLLEAPLRERTAVLLLLALLLALCAYGQQVAADLYLEVPDLEAGSLKPEDVFLVRLLRVHAPALAAPLAQRRPTAEEAVKQGVELIPDQRQRVIGPPRRAAGVLPLPPRNQAKHTLHLLL